MENAQMLPIEPCAVSLVLFVPVSSSPEFRSQRFGVVRLKAGHYDRGTRVIFGLTVLDLGACAAGNREQETGLGFWSLIPVP
jgi:hypothetical protein